MRRRKTKRRKLLRNVGITLLFIAVAYVWLANSVRINTNTQVIEVGAQEDYSITANFFGIDITKCGTQTGEANLAQLGEYEIEYAPYWTPEKFVKKIKVVDTTAPEINLEGEEVVVVTNIDQYVEPGFTAIDNYDGNITNQVKTELVKREEKFYEVHYAVMDSSGNVETAIRAISIEAGTVYLTFDDGPSLDTTPEILKILRKYNISATFFVLGYDENKEYLIREEQMEGHNIGLHGYSHKYSEIYTDIDTLMENFYQIENLVSNTTNGYESKVIRFPGGSSNTVSKRYCEGIMTEAVERVTEEGYVYFDWNVDSGDASEETKTSEEVYQNVISGIQEGKNHIILMHDFSGNTKTVEALPRIIEYCIEHGYTLKTITSETTPVHHNVSN